MNIFKFFNIGRKAALFAAALFSTSTFAQKTCMDVEKITVNENVTTIITVKPKQGGYKDGDVLAIVTVITERYRVQYSLVYTTHVDEAVSDKEVELIERNAFHNPAISMSTSDMVGYAMKVWNSPAHYRNVSTRKDKLKMRLNNIYVVGDYFFIDFSVENKTNLQFDIDELRIKLQDKKIEKATNVQTIELRPALVLDRSTSFKKGYRNVVVLKKMTFPNDKVLTLELSEKQISGRTISLDLDYEDILSANSFRSILLTGK